MSAYLHQDCLPGVSGLHVVKASCDQEFSYVKTVWKLPGVFGLHVVKASGGQVSQTPCCQAFMSSGVSG